MPTSVLLGAILVAVALPVAWVSVSGGRGKVSAATLGRGFDDVDARRMVLDRGANDRAVAPFMRALAARARRLTPAGMVERIERKLVSSGMQATWTVDQLLAVKLAMVVIVVVFGLLLLLVGAPLLLVVLGVVFGLALAYIGPDAILDGRADERAKTARRELPDILDQITIAVEAGLGFESAVARVASEADTVLAIELSRMLQDIQLGVPRSEALDGLAKRVDVQELKHFVSSMRQAERYGVPIANVLRVQSGELREKRRQAAEEHAMKIPVKVLFPLLFCILPTLFLVILGPVIIKLTQG